MYTGTSNSEHIAMGLYLMLKEYEMEFREVLAYVFVEGGRAGESSILRYFLLFSLHRKNALPEKSNETGISKSVAFIRLLSGFVMPCPVNLNQVSATATISHDLSNLNPLKEQEVVCHPVVSSPFIARQHTLAGALK